MKKTNQIAEFSALSTVCMAYRPFRIQSLGNVLMRRHIIIEQYRKRRIRRLIEGGQLVQPKVFSLSSRHRLQSSLWIVVENAECSGSFRQDSGGFVKDLEAVRVRPDIVLVKECDLLRERGHLVSGAHLEASKADVCRSILNFRCFSHRFCGVRWLDQTRSDTTEVLSLARRFERSEFLNQS